MTATGRKATDAYGCLRMFSQPVVMQWVGDKWLSEIIYPVKPRVCRPDLDILWTYQPWSKVIENMTSSNIYHHRLRTPCRPALLLLHHHHLRRTIHNLRHAGTAARHGPTGNRYTTTSFCVCRDTGARRGASCFDPTWESLKKIGGSDPESCRKYAQGKNCWTILVGDFCLVPIL